MGEGGGEEAGGDVEMVKAFIGRGEVAECFDGDLEGSEVGGRVRGGFALSVLIYILSLHVLNLVPHLSDLINLSSQFFCLLHILRVPDLSPVQRGGDVGVRVNVVVFYEDGDGESGGEGGGGEGPGGGGGEAEGEEALELGVVGEGGVGGAEADLSYFGGDEVVPSQLAGGSLSFFSDVRNLAHQDLDEYF